MESFLRYQKAWVRGLLQEAAKINAIYSSGIGFVLNDKDCLNTPFNKVPIGLVGQVVQAV